MSQQLVASMPGDIDIGGAWTVEWDAVDPTTGATISGVKVSLASVVGSDVSTPTQTPPQTEPVGPFMLIAGPDA